MKIVYFVNYFPPMNAAAAICSYKIAEYLTKFGHELLILDPGIKGKSFDLKESRDLKYDPNLTINSSSTLVKYPFSLTISHIENLVKFLFKKNSYFHPDLVLSQYHSFHLASVVGDYLSRILKVPHVIRSHDLFLDLSMHSRLYKFYNLIMHTRLFRAIQNCDIDYVQTSELRSYLLNFKKLRNLNCKVHHNGIDIDEFYPSKKQDVLKDKYGCDTIIFFIGLINRDIGIQNLIQVLPEIFKNYQDTHTVIIGDGNYRNQILKLIKKFQLNNVVHFLGIKPHHQIPFFINNSDIGIGRTTHKKIWRYFIPVKCLEYMACKKPFISTPISRDVIKNNDVGLLLKKDFNKKELIDKLSILIEDKKLRAQLGENGLKKIYKNFRWEKIMTNFNEDLENIIQNKRKII